MPNIAFVLKEEIRRLARKEVKVQVVKTRRAATQHRREIAHLKRLLRAQARKIASLEAAGKPGKSTAAADEGGLLGSSRFSSRSVRAQRKRLRLSAQEFGRLLGVSALTVYNWEKGKARPRKAQFAGLVSIRGIGRREAISKLDHTARRPAKAR